MTRKTVSAKLIARVGVLGAIAALLFLIPGMAHTSGGPGLQDVGVGLPATPKDSKHLALLALKDWVETGCAPSTLYPVAFRDNNFANGFLPDGVEYERAVEHYEYTNNEV